MYLQYICVKPSNTTNLLKPAYRKSLYRVSRGNVPDFGRMFLKLKYTDLTKNTYIRS